MTESPLMGRSKQIRLSAQRRKRASCSCPTASIRTNGASIGKTTMAAATSRSLRIRRQSVEPQQKPRDIAESIESANVLTGVATVANPGVTFSLALRAQGEQHENPNRNRDSGDPFGCHQCFR